MSSDEAVALPSSSPQGAADEASSPATTTVAFFDMDKTVLSVNSAGRYARFMYRRGKLGVGDMLRTARWLAQYRLAMIDAESVTRYAVSTLAGQLEQDMIALCLEWFETDIRRFIAPSAIAAIESHRAQGHRVVLLTAATPYIAGPVSRHLSLDDCIASQLEVDERGYFTGRAVEPICYGAGKIHWAERWAQMHHVDFSRAWFYTDSYTDLPMLEKVAQPVAVNPDPRLKRYARRNQIPIHIWR